MSYCCTEKFLTNAEVRSLRAYQKKYNSIVVGDRSIGQMLIRLRQRQNTLMTYDRMTEKMMHDLIRTTAVKMGKT